MVAFLTVHKMTKRQPAKKATGAFMAVANRHIYLSPRDSLSLGTGPCSPIQLQTQCPRRSFYPFYRTSTVHLIIPISGTQMVEHGFCQMFLNLWHMFTNITMRFTLYWCTFNSTVFCQPKSFLAVNLDFDKTIIVHLSHQNKHLYSQASYCRSGARSHSWHSQLWLWRSWCT